MKVGKLNSSQDGVVFDVHGEVQTLSAGHGNVPKIVINEAIQNTVRQGHAADNTGGGRNSMTQKHSWDIIQVNESKESNGVQPYQQNRVYDPSGIVPTLPAQMSCGTHAIKVKSATASGYEEATEGDSINYSVPNSATRRGRVGNGQAQTIDTGANQGVVVKVGKVSRSEEGKRLRKESMAKGKDHTPFQAKELDFIEQPKMNTITCATQKDNLLQEGYRIRRLTEIECERLQGFTDNWTQFGIYEKQVWINKKEKTFEIVHQKHKIPRTQRYKLCGNAVNVKTALVITQKLFNALSDDNEPTTR